MMRENHFSSVDEKERIITNRGFRSHPISPKCIKKHIVPVLVVFRNCLLEDLDQIFIR
jgi:hypothetical protein